MVNMLDMADTIEIDEDTNLSKSPFLCEIDLTVGKSPKSANHMLDNLKYIAEVKGENLVRQIKAKTWDLKIPTMETLEEENKESKVKTYHTYLIASHNINKVPVLEVVGIIDRKVEEPKKEDEPKPKEEDKKEPD